MIRPGEMFVGYGRRNIYRFSVNITILIVSTLYKPSLYLKEISDKIPPSKEIDY